MSEAPIVEYRPRGSMCARCDHRHKDCRGLPFASMRVMGQDRDGTRVVICTHFENTPPKKAAN